MRFLITGHTGFKGSWLTMMLAIQGHEVYGFSLEGGNSSLYFDARVSEMMKGEKFGDIRDPHILSQYIKFCAPEVIIHFAAQSLVLESFRNPVFTFETNVQGTLNVLGSIEESTNLKACLIITSDKVYRPRVERVSFNENDSLGGVDPYSASKSMADILTQAWINCYPRSPIVIARAGNVIGGGDQARDRLIPELVRSIEKGLVPDIRHLGAIRPWQHVLDCLNGYLTLVAKVLDDNASGAWNFGPESSELHSVSQLVSKFYEIWGVELPLMLPAVEHTFYENQFLSLDSSKAKSQLDWNCRYDFNNSVVKTVNWYKVKTTGTDMQEFSISQVNEFLTLLKA
jgi:CDP-glucose 4,6-dehydratase